MHEAVSRSETRRLSNVTSAFNNNNSSSVYRDPTIGTSIAFSMSSRRSSMARTSYQNVVAKKAKNDSRLYNLSESSTSGYLGLSANHRNSPKRNGMLLTDQKYRSGVLGSIMGRFPGQRLNRNEKLILDQQQCNDFK